MRFLTDNGFPALKLIAAAAAFVYLLSAVSSASGVLIADKNMEITGPAVISLRDISSLKSGTVDSKTIIHLSPSVKNVLVENYSYSAKTLSDELRAYTLQQAVFWAVATLALGSAVAAR